MPPTDRRRHLRAYVAFSCALGAAVVTERLAQGAAAAPWSWVLGVVAAAGLALALGWRHPIAGLAVAGAAAVVHSGAYPPDGSGAFLFTLVVPVVALSYAAGRRAAPLPALAVGAALVVLGGVLYDLRTWAGLAYLLTLIALVPWLVGRYRRQQVSLVAAGWERAEQLSVEQELVAERALARERARITQDLHDCLGHQLSLIALQASALEVRADLDDASRGIARELRSSAAGAVDSLHETVGMLRDDGAQPTCPAHETIDALVERARAAGVDVRFQRDGDAVAAPPGIERAAYRVVQESLTNATKHAPGAAVTVRIERAGESTVVTVANAAPPGGSSLGVSRGGLGLPGLEERVRMAGGALRAGVRDGVFEVVAALPHHAAGDRVG